MFLSCGKSSRELRLPAHGNVDNSNALIQQGFRAVLFHVFSLATEIQQFHSSLFFADSMWSTPCCKLWEWLATSKAAYTQKSHAYNCTAMDCHRVEYLAVSQVAHKLLNGVWSVEMWVYQAICKTSFKLCAIHAGSPKRVFLIILSRTVP